MRRIIRSPWTIESFGKTPRGNKKQKTATSRPIPPRLRYDKLSLGLFAVSFLFPFQNTRLNVLTRYSTAKIMTTYITIRSISFRIFNIFAWLPFENTIYYYQQREFRKEQNNGEIISKPVCRSFRSNGFPVTSYFLSKDISKGISMYWNFSFRHAVHVSLYT